MNRIVVFTILGSTFASTALAQSKLPPTGTVFRFSDTSPKWVTADIEFRDPRETDESLWPSFLYGKPAGVSSLAFDPEGSKIALRIECSKLVQGNGDQSRRVLGKLSDMPRVVLSLKRIGKLTTDSSGGKRKAVDYAPAEATLDIAGKSMDVNGKAKMQFRFDRKSGQFESVYLDMSFLVPAPDLGLTAGPTEIAVRAGVTGYAEKK